MKKHLIIIPKEGCTDDAIPLAKSVCDKWGVAFNRKFLKRIKRPARHPFCDPKKAKFYVYEHCDKLEVE